MAVTETKGGRYRARLRACGHDLVRTFATEVDAAVWHARARAAAYAGEPIPEATRDEGPEADVVVRPTVRSVIEHCATYKWADDKDGARSMSRAIRIARLLGLDKPIDDVSTIDLLDASKALDGSDLTAETKRKMFNAFRGGVTTWSKHTGRAAPDLRWPDYERGSKDPRALTDGEVEAFLGVMAEPYRSLFLLLLNTGLQTPGEWRALTTDSMRDDALVVKARSKGRGAPERGVPLNEAAASALACLPHGDPRLIDITADKWSAEWNRCRSALAIEDSRVTPYTLRHTFATRLARRGVHPVTIARLLGHSDVTQVMTYVKSFDSDLRGATAQLEGIDETD